MDLFFVLSGFLIGGILVDAVDSASYFSTFYIRRAYRILPLYAVLLLLTVTLERNYSWLPRYVFFLQNFWMAQAGSFGLPLIAVTWSLAVEEQFYLTLPLVIRCLPRRILLWTLTLLVLSAPLFRVLAFDLFAGKRIAAFVLMPCRADALCLGVLLALASRTPSLWVEIVRHRKYVYAALLLMVCIGRWMLAGNSPLVPVDRLGLGYSFLALLYGLLLLTTLLSPWLAGFFSWSPLRFLGVIAYGLYLFHSASLIAFRKGALWLHPAQPGSAEIVASFTGVLVCVGVAALSWRYFEKPLVERGHRYRYR